MTKGKVYKDKSGLGYNDMRGMSKSQKAYEKALRAEDKAYQKKLRQQKAQENKDKKRDAKERARIERMARQQIPNYHTKRK